MSTIKKKLFQLIFILKVKIKYDNNNLFDLNVLIQRINKIFMKTKRPKYIFK